MASEKELGVALCIEAARNFVLKVETGRARSKDSYGKFKKALALIDGKETPND